MPEEDLKWYSRLADVPGLDYQTPTRLRRAPRTHAKPRVESHNWDGKTHKSLWWDYSNGNGTSSSPAQDHFNAGPEREPAEAVIRKLDEALELPGTATDYHFILAGAQQLLFARRRDEPGRQGELYLEVERICLLDLNLVKAQPRVAVDHYSPKPKPLKLSSVDRLVTMYEREGAIRLALGVLEFDTGRGVPPPPKLEALRQRVATLDAEARGASA